MVWSVVVVVMVDGEWRLTLQFVVGRRMVAKGRSETFNLDDRSACIVVF